MEDTTPELRVTAVPQGLLITGANGSTRVRISTELRRRGAAVRAHPQGYVVPPAAGPDLLEVLPAGTAWEPNALASAERLASERGSHLESIARLGMGPADGVQGLEQLGLMLPLDPHQEAAAAAIADPGSRGLALFDEQGTGKTFSTLAGFALLRSRGLVDRMLIVAPKSVLPAWEGDAKRLLGKSFVVSTITGAERNRRVAIRHRHDILLANYESVVAELKSLRLHLAASSKRYLLVIDESYFAKNPETRRAASLAELRRLCPRAVVLSGTPAPNRPWDLVNQVELADGGVAYAGARRPSTPEDERRRVIEGLGRAAYLRRLKTDVLPNLPEQSFTEVRVAMSPEQDNLYREAAKELAIEVRSITDESFDRDLSSYLARRAALLQICSHPGGLFPLYSETPGKLRVLDELLRELIEDRGEKVLIWSWFRFALETVSRRYAHYGVARVDGSIEALADRADAVRRFQEDPGTRLFVGNPAAAGAGLTLTAARYAIYESLSNQAAHYMQSLDRIHRRGQERPVSYLVLISEGTIEEFEYERLVAKERSSRELLGDHTQEPASRMVFLTELERGLTRGHPALDASPGG
jgi:SNF2 family DNA or RNA helicase